ncbi:NADH-quinone oxidoreductase subunit L [Desulfovibrio inopinatus]|uniref:NADH-quinone oxidoreductase subunit 5 family protein n=1 Tax=Desulfovibrio inopinatus TaxID=102109 RepID=UPI00040EEEB7|nr:proton-conducting transporter membrane subunit [Desulfovibrio inopinatus]
MLDTLVFCLVVLPFLVGLLHAFVKSHQVRTTIVLVTSVIMALSSLALLAMGTFEAYDISTFIGIDANGLVALCDFVLLFVILYFGFKRKNNLIMGFAGFQILALAYLEFFLMDHTTHVPAIFADSLSLVMVLIISIVGPLIWIYALGYMKHHEEHLKLAKTKQPLFFAFLTLLLGAMNGLVLANNLNWMYFFFEVTGFCSFILISHDKTEIAIRNGERALWMNLLAGASLLMGVILVQRVMGTVSLVEVLSESTTLGAVMLLPLFFMAFAGCGKAAQVPMQSWLLGAMVAPTPVSALLHSSTMVKAGVYIVLRLAPAYVGTPLSSFIALFGAFTFLVTSAMAISQTNGKKILAYSTIANLGLIITCAGINTPAAFTAAMMLIIFHAVSKGLLFLCVGAVQQNIDSLNIEDMRGLYKRMPRTATIMIIGIMSMLLPPFGVLISKWMAIESASVMGGGMLLVVTMLALGSALTVVYWARWAGILMSTPFTERAPAPEQQPFTLRMPLQVLIVMAIVLSIFAPFIYTGLVEPVVALYYATPAFAVSYGTFASKTGIFVTYPVFLLLGLGLFYAMRAAKRMSKKSASEPYLCGVQATENGVAGFRGPLRQIVAPEASNFYLAQYFGENVLTKWVNVIALVLLAATLGGLL